MKPTAIAQATAAILLLAGAGQARALSGDEEAACGAILCLAGGAGEGACSPYLARYFGIQDPNPQRQIEKRLDFLDLCPADLPSDVRPLMARLGGTCQPAALVSYLNGQIRLCARTTQDPDDCVPTGDEWRICAPFYAHEYVIYAPPELHEDCRRERADDGAWTEVCTYTWTVAGNPAPEAETGPATGFAASLDGRGGER